MLRPTPFSSARTTMLAMGVVLFAASSLHAQLAPVPDPQQQNPAAATPAPAQAPAQTSTDAAPINNAPVFVIPAGTKIPLTLKSAISTKMAKPGDAVYLNSDFPVIVGGRVVIPAGVFVQGYVDGVERGGKLKGRAQIMMHFVSMAFPNGVVITLPGAVDNLPGAENAQVKDKEGLIESKGSKMDDAKTVGGATVAGAGIGGLAGWAAGSPGIGVGVGAGAGAAAGLVGMMMKHDADITFPAGTNVVMVMQRPLQIQEQQLNGMGSLTGYDGPNMAPVNAAQAPLPKPKPQAN